MNVKPVVYTPLCFVSALSLYRVCARLCSTPFYGLYRLTRHPVAGGLFALSFFAR